MATLYRCKCEQCGMTGLTDDVMPVCPKCLFIMALTERYEEAE